MWRWANWHLQESCRCDTSSLSAQPMTTVRCTPCFLPYHSVLLAAGPTGDSYTELYFAVESTSCLHILASTCMLQETMPKISPIFEIDDICINSLCCRELATERSQKCWHEGLNWGIHFICYSIKTCQLAAQHHLTALCCWSVHGRIVPWAVCTSCIPTVYGNRQLQ